MWLLVAVILAWTKRCAWPVMTLNEWGDFFAGVVAPLAFLWLIIGYLQQGDEVRSNTETLQLQQRALQQQVEETAALARHSEEQVKVATQRLELERQRWEHQRAADKARIQPVFTFTQGMNAGPAAYDMHFRNSGGMARHLTVVSVEPFCEVAFSSPDIEPGGEGFITVSKITSYPTMLTIAYIDKDNDEGRMRLECYQPGMFRNAPG
jgi:hypothetical protein